jgi:hypothetical protein
MANEIMNHIQVAVNLVTFANGSAPQLGNGGGIRSVTRLTAGSFEALLDLPLAPYTAPAELPSAAVLISASGSVNQAAILHPDGTKILFYTLDSEGAFDDFDVMLNIVLVKFPQIG